MSFLTHSLTHSRLVIECLLSTEQKVCNFPLKCVYTFSISSPQHILLNLCHSILLLYSLIRCNLCTSREERRKVLVKMNSKNSEEKLIFRKIEKFVITQHVKSICKHTQKNGNFRNGFATSFYLLSCLTLLKKVLK